MMRTQKEVDKHVQEVFRKITNEKERNLRCYNVAKLYHKVGDYRSTKHYVELYLKERPDVSGAHKLLGQALEGLKEYTKALEEYKLSLSLESKQPDLVLKVCELLVESKCRLNTGEAKYWIERAEEVTDNHQAVFRLKEHIIHSEHGLGDQAQLTDLVEKEIEARPQDHAPRIRLLTLYLDSKRVSEAYHYASDLESRGLFRESFEWYSCFVDILKAYHQQKKNLDVLFFVNQLSVMERYVALSLREPASHHHSVLFSNALFAFDQALFQASNFCEKEGDQLLQECVKHSAGQLSFYLGSAVLRLGKLSNLGWKEWTPFAWALMMIAYATGESRCLSLPSSTWTGKERHRKLLTEWREICAFRCSQAGYILLSMQCEKNPFSQMNADSWREKIFRLIFSVQTKTNPDTEKSSFFLTGIFFNKVPETSPSLNQITLFDSVAQLQRPDSLHSLVWFGLRYVKPALKRLSPIGTPFVLLYQLSPDFACYVFEELKLSTNALDSTGVETLCKLDVDTVLFASVLCAAAAQHKQHFNSSPGEEKSITLPVDFTESLCSKAQANWWLSAYRLHSNKSRSDIGEVRLIVSRGLEVVRLQGNHGMDVRLVVLLARLFSEKASSTLTPKDNVQDISRRAKLFWHTAVSMLERIEKNQLLRTPANPMFAFSGKELTSFDIRMLLEEGRYFLACCLMKEEKYEEAIDAFEVLNNPYSSFNQGLIYKKLADVEFVPHKGERTSDKTNYVLLLLKSRAAFYLTVDRLRSPQNAGNHPLLSELEHHLEDVENCLARDAAIVGRSRVNEHYHDNPVDESFSSYRSEDATRFGNILAHHTLTSSLGHANAHSPSHALTSTPFKSRLQTQYVQPPVAASDSLDFSSSTRVEARPSPERLDVQIRRMTVTTDAVMQVVVDQNRQMMDTLNKTRLAVENLQKELSDLKMEFGRLKLGENRNTAGKNVNYVNSVHPGEEYEYNFSSSQLPSFGPFVGEERYNYANQSTVGSVPLPGMLPAQVLFPTPQISRNVDRNILLASYYPQSTPIMPLPASVAGTVPGSSGFLPGANLSGMHNTVSSASNDSVSTVDSNRRLQELMGAPILSHSNLPGHAMDILSPAGFSSLSQTQHIPSDSSSQRSSLVTQHLAQGGVPVPRTDSMPHNFQIAMPPQATIPTTESLEKSLLPLKPVATEAVLQNVPMPTYSAISTRKCDVRPSRLSSGSGCGNDVYTEDADYNPCADFVPIIPLPAEVSVTTGEEDETPLFVRRAKLFRFCSKEWKERGIGEIKILKHNISGKVRILMRREQVLKICANHFILPEMELTAQTGAQGRAWLWAANDFSDGDAHIEKLCVRFKSVEDAQDFKQAFDEARKLAKSATPVKVSAPLNVSSTPSNESVTPTSSPASKVELGGFSFVTPPVLKPLERQLKSSPGKDKENTSAVAKPSPFAGFSFSQSANASGNQAQPVVPLSINSSSATMFSSSSSSLDFASVAALSKEPQIKKDDNFKGFAGAGSQVFGGTVLGKSLESAKSTSERESGEAEDFVPTAVFSPVVPLPSLVEVRTGEEDEKVVFEERAKLLRFDSKEWKERGVGKMKVLRNPNNGKVRLLMRRDQVLKVCCNHFLTPDLQFQPLSTCERAITWSAQDFSDGEVRAEVLALRFKTREIMQTFKDLIEGLQDEMADSLGSKETEQDKNDCKLLSEKLKPNEVKPPISDLFKPKEGSWECSECYTRNDADKISCACCSHAKPGCTVKAAENNLPLNPQFSFGIPQNSPVNKNSNFAKPVLLSCDSTALKTKPGEMVPVSSQFSFGVPSSTTDKKSDSVVPQFTFGIPSSLSVNKNSDSAKTVSSSTSEGKPLKANPPSLDEFKPKEGSWECQGCYNRCNSNQNICASCETPKPGHNNETKSLINNSSLSASFNFGSSDSTTQKVLDPKGFSFLTPVSQGSSKPTFVFGAAPASRKEDTGKGFSFGSISSSNSTDIAISTPTSDSSKPLFGSPHNFQFEMKSSSPGKSPKIAGEAVGGEESEDEEVEENSDVGDFKPVVPLPEKVPVITGEEDETVVFCHRAKLFRFVRSDKGGEWKERGLGDIKVLKHNKTNRPRLLMRREQVFKICLNHYILPDLDMGKKDEKSWTWAAQDFSEGTISPETFACRFKTHEIAAEFKDAVDKMKQEIVFPSPSLKEPGISTSTSAVSGSIDVTEAMNKFSFRIPKNEKPEIVKSLFGSDDVEVVYEAQATAEEKSAALKLKLPENFYRYKQAPPCKGCPGCDEDSDSDLAITKPSGDDREGKVRNSSAVTNSGSVKVFGGGASLFSSPSISTPSSSSIFGGLANFSPTPAKPPSSGTFSFGTLSTAVNSHSTPFHTLGSNLNSQAVEKEESFPFLSVNNSLSFASLSAGSSNSTVFQSKDRSEPFSFAGAGAQVFGGIKNESSKSSIIKNDEDDSGGEQDANETGGEVDVHDPHFEPIIAMPDMIEVRTGEEEEEKIFCQRAMLFRFDVNTKEWKERGVGEMKILKHTKNGSFRLLLRRDQVHKVVLNQRIDSQTTLKPLSTSDKAWCWGGMNYAEDEVGALEELAVRFKTPEIAGEFHSKLEECKTLLAEGSNSQEIITLDNDDTNDEEDEDGDYEDEEDGYDVLSEQHATLTSEIEGSTPMTSQVEGCIRLVMYPGHSFYVEMENETGDLMFKIPVLGDAEVQRNDNLCIWKGFDIVDAAGEIEKKFTAKFQSLKDANAFQELFSRITLDIVEQTYDYVQED